MSGLLQQKIRQALREAGTTEPLGNHQPWVDVDKRVDIIIDDAVADFLGGQPELSPQTLRWLRNYFGFDPDTYEWKRQGCGVKLLNPINHKVLMQTDKETDHIDKA